MEVIINLWETNLWETVNIKVGFPNLTFIIPLQLSVTLDSPKSFFDNDYFDLPENLSSHRMNGVVQSVSQDLTGLEKISHQNRASRSSDDQSSNGEAELMSNGGGKMMDKRHVRGKNITGHTPDTRLYNYF